VSGDIKVSAWFSERRSVLRWFPHAYFIFRYTIYLLMRSIPRKSMSKNNLWRVRQVERDSFDMRRLSTPAGWHTHSRCFVVYNNLCMNECSKKWRQSSALGTNDVSSTADDLPHTRGLTRLLIGDSLVTGILAFHPINITTISNSFFSVIHKLFNLIWRDQHLWRQKCKVNGVPETINHFAYNFAKCSPILKILSPADWVINV